MSILLINYLFSGSNLVLTISSLIFLLLTINLFRAYARIFCTRESTSLINRY
nr:MAG TPA: hypothetical protein [Caudoviricetes sp.]